MIVCREHHRYRVLPRRQLVEAKLCRGGRNHWTIVHAIVEMSLAFDWPLSHFRRVNQEESKKRLRRPGSFGIKRERGGGDANTRYKRNPEQCGPFRRNQSRRIVGAGSFKEHYVGADASSDRTDQRE